MGGNEIIEMAMLLGGGSICPKFGPMPSVDPARRSATHQCKQTGGITHNLCTMRCI